MNPDDGEDLSGLLKAWEPDVKVPKRFRSSVWSQIAAREERRGLSIGERLSAFFARPAYAAAVAVVALVASIGLAHTHAGRVTDNRRAAAEATYLASINPLARVSIDGSTLTNPHGHE